MEKQKKQRLDVLLVEKGLAPSREKAKAIIMAGIVYVDGNKEDKAGTTFPENAVIEVKGKTLPYVSRGGLKLEKAMQKFPITLSGKVCMDVGSSTGGFTDCMLQNGATKVYAIDVGHGQLAWKLRNDERVVCMEKTNIRYVVPEDIDELAAFSSIDVSFISLTKVLLPVKNLLTEDGQVVCLIKPQGGNQSDQTTKDHSDRRRCSSHVRGLQAAHCGRQSHPGNPDYRRAPVRYLPVGMLYRVRIQGLRRRLSDGLLSMCGIRLPYQIAVWHP